MRTTLLCTGIALSGIAAPPLAGQGLIVSGYASEEFVATFKKPTTHTFDAHNFNLIVLGQLGGDVFAAAEI